jgi:hypothetical protein
VWREEKDRQHVKNQEKEWLAGCAGQEINRWRRVQLKCAATFIFVFHNLTTMAFYPSAVV